MKPAKPCPHCSRALGPFAVTSRTGAPVELHRCPHCAGVWAAAGCLQDTFGEPARAQLVGGDTSRSCVECRILLTPARLPSGGAVEVCSACRGVFLDAGALDSLGAWEAVPSAPRGLPPPPLPVPRLVSAAHVPGQPHTVEEHRPPHERPFTPPSPGTFACVECGKLKPLREGQALREGLACRACMKKRMEG